MNNTTNIITEDYIDFGIARLLKEKGFDVSVSSFYDNKGKFNRKEADYNYNVGDFHYSAPTIQMAMKWLREVHNLHIEVYRTACGYLYIISKVPTGSDLYSDGDDYEGDDENSGQWTTNEKACNAAIKYCLNNLI